MSERVEWFVRCADGDLCGEFETLSEAQKWRMECDDFTGHSSTCKPHHIIKRTITEEDVTDA